MSKLLPACLPEGLESLMRYLLEIYHTNTKILVAQEFCQLSLQPFSEPQVLDLRASMSKGLILLSLWLLMHVALLPLSVSPSLCLAATLLYFHFSVSELISSFSLLPESENTTSPQDTPFWGPLIELG